MICSNHKYYNFAALDYVISERSLSYIYQNSNIYGEGDFYLYSTFDIHTLLNYLQMNYFDQDSFEKIGLSETGAFYVLVLNGHKNENWMVLSYCIFTLIIQTAFGEGI